MSARLELAVRGALRGVASRIGTAPVSLSLLALAALYLGAWIAWGRLGTPECAQALVRGGQALIALAFVASLLSRDRLELRVAEGEEFTGAPEQFAGRDPP